MLVFHFLWIAGGGFRVQLFRLVVNGAVGTVVGFFHRLERLHFAVDFAERVQARRRRSPQVRARARFPFVFRPLLCTHVYCTRDINQAQK